MVACTRPLAVQIAAYVRMSPRLAGASRHPTLAPHATAGGSRPRVAPARQAKLTTDPSHTTGLGVYGLMRGVGRLRGRGGRRTMLGGLFEMVWRWVRAGYSWCVCRSNNRIEDAVSPPTPLDTRAHPGPNDATAVACGLSPPAGAPLTCSQRQRPRPRAWPGARRA